MPDAHVDTAAQRPPTGMDEGARKLILKIVSDVANVGTKAMVGAFFHDRYGGYDDYFAAVEDVWGFSTSDSLRSRATRAAAEEAVPTRLPTR